MQTAVFMTINFPHSWLSSLMQKQLQTKLLYTTFLIIQVSLQERHKSNVSVTCCNQIANPEHRITIMANCTTTAEMSALSVAVATLRFCAGTIL